MNPRLLGLLADQQVARQRGGVPRERPGAGHVMVARSGGTRPGRPLAAARVRQRVGWALLSVGLRMAVSPHET